MFSINQVEHIGVGEIGTPADTAVSTASPGLDIRTPTSDAGVEARFV
jgi:hypothetical protein